MSGKTSEVTYHQKNHFVESYHQHYLEGNKLDLSSLDLERLESLLFGIAHAHDLIGKQVQDLSSGRPLADFSHRSPLRREPYASKEACSSSTQVRKASSRLPGN